MANDLLLSEEDLQRREFLQRQSRQKLEDLAWIIAKPQGRRVMTNILKTLGMGQMPTAANIECARIACQLQAEIMAASPKNWEIILVNVFRGNAEEEE